MIHGARARGLNACSNTAPMQILPEQPPIGTPGTTLRRNEAHPKKSKMKRILICFFLTIAMLCSMSCKKEGEQRSHFSSPQDAANRAKNDLLTVLRSRRDFALGLDQQAIETSRPSAPVRQFSMPPWSNPSAKSLLERN